ncbi:restriction endonuclease subunit S [Xanthomonas oryzae pv. oryzae]|nr:restriction endonuclease subunit S [Xanthomonas oryzae]RBI37396.1 restriction endonuclease subunit S [Xanthomonas oryzae pv. oryzae]
MVSELPGGWVETTIGEICAMGPKSAWDDGMEIGFVPMSHAPTNFRGPLNYEARRWHEVKKAYTHFENDDVIFAKVTPCFENGKAALVAGLPNGAGAGSSEFHVLRRRDAGISPSYLLAVIKSAQFLREGEENMTGAVGLRRVPRAFVENFPVRLPPEAEQKRIAQKLDALLAQVDTLKARIDAIPALLKRFRKSVVHSAVIGRLSADLRVPIEKSEEQEQLGPLESWREVTLASLGELSRGKSKHRPRNDSRLYGSEYPFIQTGDVANSGGALTSSKVFYSEFGLKQSRLFPSGTLCITIAANIADTAMLAIDACFPDSVVGFIPNKDDCVAQFIKYVIDDNKESLEALAPATAQKNINLKVLNQVKLRIPPIKEQTEIVRHVEQLFAYADQLEAKVAAAQQRIDALTQSLLAKAFRGELVPQDPSDEPASALLDRIRAQRAATPKPKRGRKAATS